MSMPATDAAAATATTTAGRPEIVLKSSEFRKGRAEGWLELERLVTRVERQGIRKLSLDELQRLVEEGDVMLLDVRPELEYRQGHIVGARSMPVAELERRLAEVPRDREVVAYCRGPYCVYSDEAAELLQRKGFRVRRFAEGFPEWRAAGLPVEANGGIALEEHH